MRTLLLTPVFFLFLNSALGQPEKVQSKTIADNFEKNYNSTNFEAIFDGFSTDMQGHLPLKETKGFLGEIKKEAGQITKREFIKYKNGFAVYKTTFEKTVFGIHIAVDNNSKINGLFVEPYIEEKVVKNKTKLILPFKEEWNVFWGGDTREQNYHVDYGSQQMPF